MFWGNTAYCARLSGEDFSRYSNKIESDSVGLSGKHFSDLPLPHIMARKQLA